MMMILVDMSFHGRRWLFYINHYLGVASLSVGVTLLHIWVWEHIAVMRLVVDRDRLVRRPYVFGYTSIVV